MATTHRHQQEGEQTQDAEEQLEQTENEQSEVPSKALGESPADGPGAADYEIVRGPHDGWSVRRVGEDEALSWHESREAAQRGAEKLAHGDQEVEVHEDRFAEDPDPDFAVSRVMLLTMGLLGAVVTLIVVLSLIGS